MQSLSTARLGGALTWLALSWGGALACSGSDRTSSSEPEPSGSAAEARSGVRPAAEMCELPSGGYSDACNGCLEVSCCPEVEACKADVACAEQLTCIVDCQHAADPGACSQGCIGTSGLHVLYTPYDDCSFDECVSTCWM